LAAPLSVVNGTLGCGGTPVGNHWANLCVMIVSNKNAGIHVGS